MPAKLSLICLIHSVNEKDSSNYIIREAIGIVRKEDNTSMDLRITSFIPKSTSAPRWVPLFVPGNVLRLTGKFVLEEEPPHGILEMTANAGDLMELNQDNLPASSITVIITGFITEDTQNDNTFKSIKVITNEFIGGGSAGKKFSIKCRYLRSDERIDKKIIKIRKNSSVMITGELTLVNSEFQIDIQDLNFLPMSMANIESTTTTSNSTSLYSWSKTTSLGRLSAQSMANTASSNNSTPNSSNPNTQTTNINDTKDINDVNNEIDEEVDDESTTILASNIQTHPNKKRRTKK